MSSEILQNQNAEEPEETTSRGTVHESHIGKQALINWLSFAKTQAITTELLQFEMDALADALEFKAKAIIEAFEEIVMLMQQHPVMAENKDVSKSLSHMVRSLQFQDIAKQKLENISDALKTVHEYANSIIIETDNEYGIDIDDVMSNEESIDRIVTDRTLAEMRKNMMKNLELLSKTDFERLLEFEGKENDNEENNLNVELF